LYGHHWWFGAGALIIVIFIFFWDKNMKTFRSKIRSFSFIFWGNVVATFLGIYISLSVRDYWMVFGFIHAALIFLFIPFQFWDMEKWIDKDDA